MGWFGRSNWPDVECDHLAPASDDCLAVAKQPREPRLDAVGHFTHVREEQRAADGLVDERARHDLLVTGSLPGFAASGRLATEQGAFEFVRRDLRTRDGHERGPVAACALVDGARHHLAARAALPGDEYTRASSRRLLNLRDDLVHARGAIEDVVDDHGQRSRIT